MRYVRNPTECDAFEITSCDPPSPEGMMVIHCKGGLVMFASKQQTARFTPKEGDYVVISTVDQYTYLNPRDVFERNWHKWTPADVPNPTPTPDKPTSDS